MKEHYLVFPELMSFLCPLLIIKCIYHLYTPCNPLSPSSILFMLYSVVVNNKQLFKDLTENLNISETVSET